SGRMAASARALTAGSSSPRANSSGAPSGALANEDAAIAAGQLRSSTSTTACGRVATVSPGYTVRATAAASATGSDPPMRVVFFVATAIAPGFTGAERA